MLALFDCSTVVFLVCLTATTTLSDTLKNPRLDVTDQILDYQLNGKGKGETSDRLAAFVDTIGPRMAGTPGMDKAVKYMLEKLTNDGLDNVHAEDVIVPKWIRGSEEAFLITPRRKEIAILGLGSTIPTPPAGITADAVVVKSFEELDSFGAAGRISGKIVVFNQAWAGYGAASGYRRRGASRASKYGALATLIRSATSFSIYSPHTGQQNYAPGVKKIPTACLTVEDAEMLQRMQNRKQPIRIYFRMTSRSAGNTTSQNTIAQITGSLYPQEIVLISGHLDSWDVGQGAMDDGGGVAISWQALHIFKQLYLRPKRTVRAIFWAAEEQGLYGSKQYYEKHKNRKMNETFVFVAESDEGAFAPSGLHFKGSPSAQDQMKKILSRLSKINATNLYSLQSGEDVNSWMEYEDVPGASISESSKTDYYFTFHHSNGDTMTVFKPGDLDNAAALWAVMAYEVANLDKPLPKA